MKSDTIEGIILMATGVFGLYCGFTGQFMLLAGGGLFGGILRGFVSDDPNDVELRDVLVGVAVIGIMVALLYGLHVVSARWIANAVAPEHGAGDLLLFGPSLLIRAVVTFFAGIVAVIYSFFTFPFGKLVRGLYDWATFDREAYDRDIAERRARYLRQQQEQERLAAAERDRQTHARQQANVKAELERRQKENARAEVERQQQRERQRRLEQIKIEEAAREQPKTSYPQLNAASARTYTGNSGQTQQRQEERKYVNPQVEHFWKLFERDFDLDHGLYGDRHVRSEVRKAMEPARTLTDFSPLQKHARKLHPDKAPGLRLSREDLEDLFKHMEGLLEEARRVATRARQR